MEESGRRPPTEAMSALALTLHPLDASLRRNDVTELCINRPGELFLETHEGWRCEALPAADFAWCTRLAKLVANASSQRVDAVSPLLSASLPGGERIQVVLPPATPRGCVAISIRRPSRQAWRLEELARRGALHATRVANPQASGIDRELDDLLRAGHFERFLSLAVRARKNIIVSGATGSGKTTWIQALIQEIPPDERLITIEDAAELRLDGHANHVRLFYSKDDQGVARITPRRLLESSLRMKPDRILLAELRSEEAFDYLRNVNSGHPGSITSVHASSARLAFEQLVLLVKQSPGGRGLARRDIRRLLHLLIDVVVQCGVEGHRRHVREIWFKGAGCAAPGTSPGAAHAQR